MSSLLDLDDGILWLIVAHCGAREVGSSLARASRRLRALCDADATWAALYARDYGGLKYPPPNALNDHFAAEVAAAAAAAAASSSSSLSSKEPPSPSPTDAGTPSHSSTTASSSTAATGTDVAGVDAETESEAEVETETATDNSGGMFAVSVEPLPLPLEMWGDYADGEGAYGDDVSMAPGDPAESAPDTVPGGGDGGDGGGDTDTEVESVYVDGEGDGDGEEEGEGEGEGEGEEAAGGAWGGTSEDIPPLLDTCTASAATSTNASGTGHEGVDVDVAPISEVGSVRATKVSRDSGDPLIDKLDIQASEQQSRLTGPSLCPPPVPSTSCSSSGMEGEQALVETTYATKLKCDEPPFLLGRDYYTVVYASDHPLTWKDLYKRRDAEINPLDWLAPRQELKICTTSAAYFLDKEEGAAKAIGTEASFAKFFQCLDMVAARYCLSSYPELQEKGQELHVLLLSLSEELCLTLPRENTSVQIIRYLCKEPQLSTIPNHIRKSVMRATKIHTAPSALPILLEASFLTGLQTSLLRMGFPVPWEELFDGAILIMELLGKSSHSTYSAVPKLIHTICACLKNCPSIVPVAKSRILPAFDTALTSLKVELNHGSVPSNQLWKFYQIWGNALIKKAKTVRKLFLDVGNELIATLLAQAAEKLERAQHYNPPKDIICDAAIAKVWMARFLPDQQAAQDHFAEAISLFKMMKNRYLASYNIACVYSIVNNSEKCKKWVFRALEYPHTSVQSLEEDPDFANVRGQEWFQNIIEQLRSAGRLEMRSKFSSFP
ncbi:hypothetical protein Pelo_5531 [Pelomyxa schiedti]|nr:hypothetical protein Pelo_5531 [Pelomyxa schiedti]